MLMPELWEMYNTQHCYRQISQISFIPLSLERHRGSQAQEALVLMSRHWLVFESTHVTV